MTVRVEYAVALSSADDALDDLHSFGGIIEDGSRNETALAICLAARAVCLELRALSVLHEYGIANQ